MKQAREAVRESETLRRLATVVRDARDAITVVALDGRILAWNPGAERLYGWTEAEALAMNIDAMVSPGHREEIVAMVRRIGQSDSSGPYRIERSTKDGLTLPISLTASPLVKNNGEVYAVAMTERESK